MRDDVLAALAWTLDRERRADGGWRAVSTRLPVGVGGLLRAGQLSLFSVRVASAVAIGLVTDVGPPCSQPRRRPRSRRRRSRRTGRARSPWPARARWPARQGGRAGAVRAVRVRGADRVRDPEPAEDQAGDARHDEDRDEPRGHRPVAEREPDRPPGDPPCLPARVPPRARAVASRPVGRGAGGGRCPCVRRARGHGHFRTRPALRTIPLPAPDSTDRPPRRSPSSAQGYSSLCPRLCSCLSRR